MSRVYVVKRTTIVFALFAARACSLTAAWADGVPPRLTIELGAAVVPLNGPWKFHLGDDPRWADPAFDDSDWEQVDLTPSPGAHDGDVGLLGYVPGWKARGHADHWGHAWYRLHFAVSAPVDSRLALTGPLLVDDAYQLFLDGQLLGGSSPFPGPTPIVYGVQPSLFPLSPLQVRAGAPAVLALRVWMSEDTLLGSNDSGGVHIAPALGEATAIEARHRLEWWDFFTGYIADALEPLALVALAALSLVVFVAERKNRAYPWLSAALMAHAMLRSFQIVVYWTHWASIDTLEHLRIALAPFMLAAWVMTWREWFQVLHPTWLPRLTALLAVLLASALLAGPELSLAQTGLRCGFLALILFAAGSGIHRLGRRAWPAVPAVVAGLVAQFAPEWNALHLPGIWFPFGVGVSRTQFALAALIVLLTGLLLGRLISMAREGSSRVMPLAP